MSRYQAKVWEIQYSTQYKSISVGRNSNAKALRRECTSRKGKQGSRLKQKEQAADHGGLRGDGAGCWPLKGLIFCDGYVVYWAQGVRE